MLYFLTIGRKRRSKSVVCFVVLWQFFSVSLLCLGSMWCFVSLFLVISTSAINCLERLISEMTCYVSSGTLHTHSPEDKKPCEISASDSYLQR